MKADIMYKVKYLVSKHPEIEYCLRQKDCMERLRKIGQFDRRYLITSDPNEWRFYVLFKLLQDPKLRVREIGMYEVLDIAMGRSEDVESLSSIRSDILVLHDGETRSMSHEQKDVFIDVLWNSSPIVIYEWLGSYQTFRSRSRFPEYLMEVSNESGNTKCSQISRAADPDIF